MRTLAIIPIKKFGTGKQRLSKVLADGSRRSLAQAMFSDVLGSLRRSIAVDQIAVVTDDIVVESVATGERTVLLSDTRASGQSAAASIGIAYAVDRGFERVLLVPGDTPLLDPVELDGLLARCEHDRLEVGIVADRHGTGTNGLVVAPPDGFAPSFGPGSFDRHVEQARGGELTYRVEAAPSLAHDIDTPDDLAALWATIEQQRRGAQRTRGALAQLERSGARATVESAGAAERAAAEAGGTPVEA
ncbi:MAG: 2-phospho-L-lactate/phosphoenolpyruvate guanylyltransferase [Thermoleophilaceae bacterium]|jgi:2-phospho-L-lactate guanylyltransferase|nr:2-phospho-L-lactate/phosphoenolpyruvate guanylyltransferase [Thermoleophilaceae bacterium]